MVEKEEIRNQIIEVARGIFSKYGFKKTTMDEIAAGIRKGKSSIYYYFPGKEDIYKAVIEKEAEILRETIAREIMKASGPTDKIKAYIQTRMKTVRDLVNFYEALKNDYLIQLDFIDQIRKKYFQEEISICEGFLSEGVKTGLFTIEETDLASIAVVTAMHGLEVPLLVQSNAIDLDERIEHLVNMLFYGIVKR